MPLRYRARDVEPFATRHIALPAYAKVNLALEVVGRRADGFHDLCSVVVIVDWHDLVTVRCADSAGPGSVVVTADGATAQPDMAAPGGLAARAAAAGRELGLPSATATAVSIHLHKRLPVAAGLGGGSADAAAVLRAMATLAAEPPPTGDLLQAAAELGSDAPAALVGGTLLLEGRGDRLTPLPGRLLHLVIAVAGSSATAPVYAALRDTERRSDGRAQRVATALTAAGELDPADLGSALEPAAARTNLELAARLSALRHALAEQTWYLTGSGGAAFALTATAAAADQLAARARAAGFPARACRTLTVAPLCTPRSPPTIRSRDRGRDP
ncbi:MAG TPA: 4-(cytidine 5'-diphospho)-2-C-methyl-D-erythritol kinase [Candidatus Dormibacteraeota bacterium]